MTKDQRNANFHKAAFPSHTVYAFEDEYLMYREDDSPGTPWKFVPDYLRVRYGNVGCGLNAEFETVRQDGGTCTLGDLAANVTSDSTHGTIKLGGTIKMHAESPKESVCHEAHRIIDGARRTSYGPVGESFGRIAKTWSAILNVEVTAGQVALCMIGLKVCREANAHHRDNLVDVCGYARCAELLKES